MESKHRVLVSLSRLPWCEISKKKVVQYIRNALDHYNYTEKGTMVPSLLASKSRRAKKYLRM